jgi:hypothetical protein
MSTSIFIEQLAAGHAADAKETLSNLLSARAFEALDARKQELGATLFGSQVEEEVEQVEEVTTRQVKDFHDVLDKHADAGPAVKKFNADAGNRKKFNKAHDAIVQHDIAATNYDRKYRDAEMRKSK